MNALHAPGPARRRASLLMAGAATRVAVATAFVAALWLCVFWALR